MYNTNTPLFVKFWLEKNVYISRDFTVTQILCSMLSMKEKSIGFGCHFRITKKPSSHVGITSCSDSDGEDDGIVAAQFRWFRWFGCSPAASGWEVWCHVSYKWKWCLLNLRLCHKTSQQNKVGVGNQMQGFNYKTNFVRVTCQKLISFCFLCLD